MGANRLLLWLPMLIFFLLTSLEGSQNGMDNHYSHFRRRPNNFYDIRPINTTVKPFVSPPTQKIRTVYEMVKIFDYMDALKRAPHRRYPENKTPLNYQ